MPHHVTRTSFKAIPGSIITLSCPNCQSPVTGYRSELLRGERYCSPKCSAEYLSKTRKGTFRIVRQSKDCEFCGKTFNDTPYKIKTGRRFCSHNCANNYIGIGRLDPIGYNFNHRLARKIVNLYHGITECFVCCSKYDLIVHHKDNIQTNNDISNLEVLCRECHSRHHRMTKAI